MDVLETNRKNKNVRHSTMGVSFSANLPNGVRGICAESLCVVKYSVDPFVDFRESIMEMIRHIGVRDWKEMEELAYCYVVLNPPDVHGFIEDAFMSFCSCHLG
ncbi:hypothetical protein MRB53_019560 [Persea americana]|uniref:Uncharacterized protein n=1 Tax=Persea americana TaxID=3435 RepID=A0ACC2KYQ6_PERAE|nr:hypothetical protein MRB53_019560 [Persea americana]